MTTRYVGKGGSDANSGASWALRKLTIAGVEAIVAAGDVVYIGPGTYREEFVSTINGSSGNTITFIGDVTGEHTDQIGGFIRITASDNDSTSARAQAATCTHDFRTFQNIIFDMGSTQVFDGLGASNLVLEYCTIAYGSGGDGLILSRTASHANTIRRCYFIGTRNHIRCEPGANTAVSHDISNCIFVGGNRGLLLINAGGIDCIQCLFIGIINGINVSGNTNDLTVYNCTFMGCSTAIVAGATTECTENYNNFFSNGTNLTNVTSGANSSTVPPYMEFPMLLDTFNIFPWNPFALSEFSQLTSVAGTAEKAVDFYGMTRPATGQRSRGPIQYPDIQKSGTAHSGSFSLELTNAARMQMVVPASNVSTDIEVYVRRGANYAGTLPQIVIRQPGQAPVTITDVGAASTWNLLSTTLTPAADPKYIVIEFVSNNTAVAADVSVNFDSLLIT